MASPEIKVLVNPVLPVHLCTYYLHCHVTMFCTNALMIISVYAFFLFYFLVNIGHIVISHLVSMYEQCIFCVPILHICVPCC